MNSDVIRLADEAATLALGAALEKALPAVACVYLAGDLGAGKTTLVRGLLGAAGHAGAVRSPTYTLVEPYSLQRGEVFHLDLYRLADPEELEFIGLREFSDQGLLLIEWPERGAGVLPAADLWLSLDHAGAARTARLQVPSDDPRGLASVIQPLVEKLG